MLVSLQAKVIISLQGWKSAFRYISQLSIGMMVSTYMVILQGWLSITEIRVPQKERQSIYMDLNHYAEVQKVYNIDIQ